jgi:hypothetical protein
VTGRSAVEQIPGIKDDKYHQHHRHSLGIQNLKTTSLWLVSRRNKPAKPQGGSRPASTEGLLAGHAQSAWQFATDKSSMYRIQVAQRLVGNRWSITLPEEVGPDAYKDVEKTSRKYCKAIGISALGLKRRVDCT